MAKLVWSQVGDNRYEYGVDRGVLYTKLGKDTYGSGVVWNGLLNVEESNVGGGIASYHFDGIKYLDMVEPKNYQASVSSYDIPYSFMTLVGDQSVIPGFVLTRQSRNLFGLSYRTFVGGVQGYKIHLVYNALAKKKTHSSATQSESQTVKTSSWTVNTTPVRSRIFRPASHFIFDSVTADKELLDLLEDILYGSPTQEPRLPTVQELVEIIWLWDPLLIVPNTLSGLSPLQSGVGDLYRTENIGLNKALPSTRLKPTETDGLYRLEEG